VKKSTKVVEDQFASPLVMIVQTLTAEENRVAVEVESRVTLKNGVFYNNKYHFLFRLEDGKIREVREHNDTLHAHQIWKPILMAHGVMKA
jgi:ketosteroid isomerase-like protein